MLEDLGSSPTHVADALRARRIVGVRNTVRTLNPIVRYVQSMLGNVYSIDVIRGIVMRIEFADRTVQEVAVPEAVQQFLAAFNRGDYPDLELFTGSG
jgi:hypothetical protein